MKLTANPCFSIVTPSFNQAQYLEQTINSVLDQGYENLEYIIIDGGSTDGSIEIIKKYEKHLAYWESVPDRGQSHAINKGLKHCTGDIFNWINSDDYYNLGVFRTIAETFLENDVYVVGGKERSFFSETSETNEIYSGTKISGNLSELIYQGIIDQPPTFWRLDMVRKLGPLPEQLHYTMDSFWWTKYLLLHGSNRVRKVDDIITNFRLHDESKSATSQVKFEKERRSIRNELSKALDFSPLILNYYDWQETISLEDFFNDCKNLDNKAAARLEAVFAKHIYPRYYMKYDYGNAKSCFKLYLKNPALNGKLIIDFIKFFLLPKALLMSLRMRPVEKVVKREGSND